MSKGKGEPQQDGRRGKIAFRIKHTCQRHSEGSNKPCVHQDPKTHRDWDRTVFECLLWHHCSFLLGPGAHRIRFVPSKNLFPHSYVSSDSYMMGLIATSSKRAYAMPTPAAP